MSGQCWMNKIRQYYLQTELEMISHWLNPYVLQLLILICAVNRSLSLKYVMREIDNIEFNVSINNSNVTSVSSSVFGEATNTLCPRGCSCLNDYFECKRLSLKQVPPLPSWVRNLELTGNKLDDNVGRTIGNITELLSLNLKKNRLQKIPVFQGLDSLSNLILSHNRIQVVTPDALLSLPNLRRLDLSKNQIRIIQQNTFPVKNILNFLNLNHNRLSILEKSSLDHLNRLCELRLSRNRLKNLPNGIFKMLKNLKKLDLNNNQINVTWSTFTGLNELERLNIRSNGLTNLPAGVFHSFKAVEVIELDSNCLARISRGEFFNLTSLRELFLSNNSISRIEPDTWEYTQQLAILDLSLNHLTNLTRSNLNCLTRLKKLNLARNRITSIADGTFNCVSNLQQLNMSGNQLSWIIEDSVGPFAALKKLTQADLSANNVKSISQKSFAGLGSLEVLNLSQNNLVTIQYKAFEPVKNLHELYINSSNFLCDCNLRWLHIWIKEAQLSGHIAIVCDYPMNLRGQEVGSLKDTDFVCNDSPRPRLLSEPSDQLAIKDTNLTLECSALATGLSNMTFQWRRDDTDIDAAETLSKTDTSANSTILSSYLTLYNVNNGQHSGKYQCVVDNNFGPTYSRKFKITVATYPKFTKIPLNVSLNSGATARLDCSASGEPTPQIAWQKDGGNDFPAARERRMHVMPSDHAFYIIDAKISDMGLYTCTAQNAAGIIKANAILTVYEPPTFIKPLKSKEVITGKSSVLECMTSGSPKPTLRWFKDSKPIPATDRHFFAADGQLLIIVDTVLSDAGRYQCDIYNDLGKQSGYLTLKVNKFAKDNVVNVEEMTSIIIITVFCCAVGTSVIWVVIIYQTKKVNECNNSNFNLSPSGDYNAYQFVPHRLCNDPNYDSIPQQAQQEHQQRFSPVILTTPKYNILQTRSSQQQVYSNNSEEMPPVIISINIPNDNDNLTSNNGSLITVLQNSNTKENKSHNSPSLLYYSELNTNINISKTRHLAHSTTCTANALTVEPSFALIKLNGENSDCINMSEVSEV